MTILGFGSKASSSMKSFNARRISARRNVLFRSLWSFLLLFLASGGGDVPFASALELPDFGPISVGAYRRALRARVRDWQERELARTRPSSWQCHALAKARFWNPEQEVQAMPEAMLDGPLAALFDAKDLSEDERSWLEEVRFRPRAHRMEEVRWWIDVQTGLIRMADRRFSIQILHLQQRLQGAIFAEHVEASETLLFWEKQSIPCRMDLWEVRRLAALTRAVDRLEVFLDHAEQLIHRTENRVEHRVEE